MITAEQGVVKKLKSLAKRVAGLHVQVQCPIESHGSEYGGWTICPRRIAEDAVVYSFGVGKDITFDLSLIQKYGLHVHAFDPTPDSVAWIARQQIPPQFHLHEYGIADYDGKVTFYAPDNPTYVSHSILPRAARSQRTVEVPVRRLATILNDLQHDHIDILKMDIEGAEYRVLRDVVCLNVPISQILVEFHHSFAEISPLETLRIVWLLQRHGYRVFHISHTGLEYAFIRLSTG